MAWPSSRAARSAALQSSSSRTAYRHPYIDILEPGRLIIALGGNGRGAQAADAIGYLTAHLALAGQWRSGLPRDAFRHVPADGPWNGMTLLRDQARTEFLPTPGSEQG